MSAAAALFRARSFTAGSAVGVSLMRGDIQLGALGTVTWVGDDGEILAFGHPFMQRGDSCYFMNKAWILASLPNLDQLISW